MAFQKFTQAEKYEVLQKEAAEKTAAMLKAPTPPASPEKP